jgi:hypothetical protein
MHNGSTSRQGKRKRKERIPEEIMAENSPHLKYFYLPIQKAQPTPKMIDYKLGEIHTKNITELLKNRQ